MATTIIKEKFECDVCDGCGWYEGGPVLINRCFKCNGLGYIEIEKEDEVKHKWRLGEWKREGWNQVREDTCKLCGCKRHITQRNRKGRLIKVVQYIRSKIFHKEIEPECWGAKNPQ